MTKKEIRSRVVTKNEEIEKTIKKLLFEDLELEKTQHLEDTPNRVMLMLITQLFSSVYKEPPIIKTFKSNHDQMVTTKQIPFYSTCAHHLLPFFGTASVSYIPNGKIIGLSKFARIIDYYAKKPQVQEEMTGEIAEFIMKKLEPKGCGVLINARHLCMEMRGVEKTNEFVTTSLRGNFYEDSVKDEFLRSSGI